MQVIWNGDKAGPNRGLLIVEADLPRHAEPKYQFGITDATVALLSSSAFPLALTEIAYALKSTTHAVNGALYQLRRNGVVDVIHVNEIAPSGKPVRYRYFMVLES